MDPADRCLALGPVEDGTLFRCTRGAGHDGRHRNQRTYPDKRWAVTYQPLVQDGELVDTYRPGRHPGPDPGSEQPAQNGSQVPVPTVDPERLREVSQDYLPEDRESLWGAEANKSDTSGSAVKSSSNGLEISDVTRVDQLDELDPPRCDDVPWSGLSATRCRGIWIKTDRDHGTLIHACTKPEGHSGRCRCACGKRRSDKTYGPVEPTDRPEQTLEEIEG